MHKRLGKCLDKVASVVGSSAVQSSATTAFTFGVFICTNEKKNDYKNNKNFKK